MSEVTGRNRVFLLMKILTVCAGGNCRSVTLATLLKFEWKHDAIAASVNKNGDELFNLLIAWCNRILTVDTGVHEKFLTRFPHAADKTTLLNIGQDRWGMSMHPDLVPLAHRLITEWVQSPGRRSPQEIIAHGTKYDVRRKAYQEAAETKAQPPYRGETEPGQSGPALVPEV